MEDQQHTQQELSIDKVGASAVGKDVKIADDGVFIGRDHIEGWKPNDVILLVETVLNHFTKGMEPAELDVALDELRDLLDTLYEWKEVHNALDTILNAYFQYREELDRQNGLRQKPDMEGIRLRWKAISKEVEEIVALAKGIRIIDNPYLEVDDPTGGKKVSGPKWAIEIKQSSEQIDLMLHISENARDNHIEGSVLSIFGGKPSWWKNLKNLSNEFHHSVYWHMHKVDKKLRETALKLAELAHRILRRVER